MSKRKTWHDLLSKVNQREMDDKYKDVEWYEQMEKPTVDQQSNNVNHPPHYNQGSVECIQAIEAMLTPEEFRGHCKANAVKYIWREAYKGNDESIDKAIWYLQRMRGRYDV